jgi:hypothetical protein
MYQCAQIFLFLLTRKHKLFWCNNILCTILVMGVCPGADKQGPLPTYYNSTQK